MDLLGPKELKGKRGKRYSVQKKPHSLATLMSHTLVLLFLFFDLYFYIYNILF